MPTLEKVTCLDKANDFCLTDCGPADGCIPDDVVIPPKKEKKPDGK